MDDQQHYLKGMNTDPHPPNLRDDEWTSLQPLIAPGKEPGHPQGRELRRIVDAVLCLLHTGYQWRALLRDVPPWTAVFSHCAEWRRRGIWEQVNTSLREQQRLIHCRTAQPAAAIIDGQPACTAEANSPCEYDGAKKGPFFSVAPSRSVKAAFSLR